MTTIDQSTGEVLPDTTLARVAPEGSSRVLALDSMAEAAFSDRLALLRQSQDRMRRIQRELLVDGEDFGAVPGVKKPMLLKPGAEKLLKFYGLCATFEIERHLDDGVHGPAVHVVAIARIHVGDAGGPVIAEGCGTANSWETKYRYRRGERLCPKCGAAAIIAGKAEFGGGWLCWGKKGGCGAKFPAGAPEIEGQAVGDVQHPDPLDLDNTLVKMAKKRALVDGTLLATATSGLFSQDMEDVALSAPAPAPQSAPAPSTDPAAPWIDAYTACTTIADVQAVERRLPAVWKALPGAARKAIREAGAARVAAIKAALAANEDAEPPADVPLPDMGGAR